MRRPEHLTDTERKLLTEVGERCPALASITEYGRRLAALLRDRSVTEPNLSQSPRRMTQPYRGLSW
ncbi:hypothetical protein GCM10009575_032430 [Streptomyces rhizosphaericus]|uniref:Uncharacterized protein n=1 Tax=Streptomyces rhizosphaericus TaxID=114699 RepID=A0ABP4A1N2_9ACTN